MAKSKSFFGLRRGSTKSLTFSVYRGQQVTKDRVSVVKNPKTAAQAMQRMKASVASIIYRNFREVITRGQEGVAYGNESRIAWLKRAFSFEPQAFVNKGNTSLMGFPAPLTKGSLPEIVTSYNGESEAVTIPSWPSFGEDADLTGATIIANTDVEDGDQLAVVAILFDSSTAQRTFAHVGSIIIHPETTSVQMMQALLPQSGSFGLEDGNVEISFGDYTPLQVAIVHSRLSNGSYLRSTANFDWAQPENDEWKQAALQTWLEGGSTAALDWPDVQQAGAYTGIEAVAATVYTGTDTRTATTVLQNLAYNSDGDVVNAYVVDNSGNLVTLTGAASVAPAAAYLAAEGTDTVASTSAPLISKERAKLGNA